MATRPVSSDVVKVPRWTELNDLSCSSVGGEVLFSTDDWFASAERLLDNHPAEWREGFTEQGKWMDGWETRRKRIPGHDWCLIKLGLPGQITGIELDTSFFTGNYTPRASVQAVWLEKPPKVLPREGGAGKAATPEQFAAAHRLRSDRWRVIVKMADLAPGYSDTCRSFFNVKHPGPYNYIRLNMFPDGGIARLRTYGVAVPNYDKSLGEKIDFLAAEVGGVCVGYSDAHYGHPRNIIARGRGVDMGDGWETARRLDRPPVLTTAANDTKGILQVPGNEWAAFRLGIPGTITDVEIDTNHFKGNFPDSVTIEGAELPADVQQEDMYKDDIWKPILPAVKLTAHAQHFFGEDDVEEKAGFVTHVRVKMFPDGGISRVRLMGTPSQAIETLQHSLWRRHDSREM